MLTHLVIVDSVDGWLAKHTVHTIQTPINVTHQACVKCHIQDNIKKTNNKMMPELGKSLVRTACAKSPNNAVQPLQRVSFNWKPSLFLTSFIGCYFFSLNGIGHFFKISIMKRANFTELALNSRVCVKLK